MQSHTLPALSIIHTQAHTHTHACAQLCCHGNNDVISIDYGDEYGGGHEALRVPKAALLPLCFNEEELYNIRFLL